MNIRKKILASLLLTLYLVAFGLAGVQTKPNPSPAQTASTPDQTASLRQVIPTDPLLTTGMLANGLRYYIRLNKKPENRAELRLVVNAGSVLEDADQRGLAHFVEHMAFNGTKHFAKQELVKFMESIGMRFGPSLNAYTSFDETVYMLQIPTDKSDVRPRRNRQREGRHR
jgi:zinc protease